jgi:hypothetical protein
MCLLKSELARAKVNSLIPAIVLLISKILEKSIDLTLLNLEKEFNIQTEVFKAIAKVLIEWICWYEEVSKKELTSCKRKFESEKYSAISKMNLVAQNK